MRKIKIVKFGETQNSKKLWAYFIALTRTDKFQKEVIEIRKLCKIPANGFRNRSEFEKSEFNKGDWTKNPHQILLKEESLLCKKYNLFPGHWWIPIENFIFFSKLQKPDMLSGELCTFWDFVQDSESSWLKSTIKEFNDFYPLGIRISPYATQRDIIDYIKRNSKTLKHFQQQYKKDKNNISRVRLTRFKYDNRNEFIYKNRNLSRKLIAEKLSTELGEDMDEGHIAKIISIEKSRRKKV